MKKTLTLAFAFLLCTLFCLGAAAFEMESVESAAEAIAKDLEPCRPHRFCREEQGILHQA